MTKAKKDSTKDEQAVETAGVENPVFEEENTENAASGEENTENTASSEGNSGEDSSGNTDDAQPVEDAEGEEKYLVAVYPILYLSHQYKIGDRLPANNPEMVQAWLDAGTADWMCVSMKAPKARPRTAQPGISGQAAYSESEDGDNLAGKVPITSNRKK